MNNYFHFLLQKWRKCSDQFVKIKSKNGMLRIKFCRALCNGRRLKKSIMISVTDKFDKDAYCAIRKPMMGTDVPYFCENRAKTIAMEESAEIDDSDNGPTPDFDSDSDEEEIYHNHSIEVRSERKLLETMKSEKTRRVRHGRWSLKEFLLRFAMN